MEFHFFLLFNLVWLYLSLFCFAFLCFWIFSNSALSGFSIYLFSFFCMVFLFSFLLISFACSPVACCLSLLVPSYYCDHALPFVLSTNIYSYILGHPRILYMDLATNNIFNLYLSYFNFCLPIFHFG